MKKSYIQIFQTHYFMHCFPLLSLSLVVVGRRVHHLLVLEDKYLLQGIAAQEQEQPHYIS